MIKYNGKLLIIGVDMSYGNMKTASCHFPTGIEKYDSKRTVSTRLQTQSRVWRTRSSPSCTSPFLKRVH